MKRTSFFRKLNRTEILLLAFLSVLLAVFAFFLERNFDTARRSGVFEGRRHAVSRLLTHTGTSATGAKIEIGRIESWMTFQYVNVVFGMPDEYLEGELGISDPKYPNVPIGSYAKRHGLNPQAVVFEIREAVARFESSYPAE